MMTKKLGVKALVILFSCTLVITLILYKGGYIASETEQGFSSPNGGVLPKKVVLDTTRKKERTFLPSSKSIILAKPAKNRDSISDTLDSQPLTQEEILLLSGSKSGVIFQPKTVDTAKHMTKPVKTAPKKKKQ